MTDLYAVFGNPVAHSKSPLIHSVFAQATTQDLIYEARLAAVDGFKQAISDFQAAGGKGANVTVRSIRWLLTAPKSLVTTPMAPDWCAISR